MKAARIWTAISNASVYSFSLLCLVSGSGRHKCWTEAENSSYHGNLCNLQAFKFLWAENRLLMPRWAGPIYRVQTLSIIFTIKKINNSVCSVTLIPDTWDQIWSTGGWKEKLVSLEIVRGYLCHLDLKHISRITEFLLPFPFLIIKGRYYTLSNNLKLLSSWNS